MSLSVDECVCARERGLQPHADAEAQAKLSWAASRVRDKEKGENPRAATHTCSWTLELSMKDLLSCAIVLSLWATNGWDRRYGQSRDNARNASPFPYMRICIPSSRSHPKRLYIRGLHQSSMGMQNPHPRYACSILNV